ncbi:hypothetical protein BDZ89DRAFT_223401 [Hymenopellis radicata]|nr:hypothetical protein BDZ89DRAFT_223401 [Hymenopellis radicata]
MEIARDEVSESGNLHLIRSVQMLNTRQGQIQAFDRALFRDRRKTRNSKSSCTSILPLSIPNFAPPTFRCSEQTPQFLWTWIADAPSVRRLPPMVLQWPPSSCSLSYLGRPGLCSPPAVLVLRTMTYCSPRDPAAHCLWLGASLPRPSPIRLLPPDSNAYRSNVARLLRVVIIAYASISWGRVTRTRGPGRRVEI